MLALVVKDPGNWAHPPNPYTPKYKDLIDWPAGHDSLVAASDEDSSCCRDGYVMNAANAPINA